MTRQQRYQYIDLCSQSLFASADDLGNLDVREEVHLFKNLAKSDSNTTCETEAPQLPRARATEFMHPPRSMYKSAYCRPRSSLLVRALCSLCGVPRADVERAIDLLKEYVLSLPPSKAIGTSIRARRGGSEQFDELKRAATIFPDLFA